MNIMRRTIDLYFGAALLASLWLGGCSTDDIPLDQEVGRFLFLCRSWKKGAISPVRWEMLPLL